MAPDRNRRSGDREFSLEDELVTNRYCDLRHEDVERRVGSIETSNKELAEDIKKANFKLVAIFAVISFVGFVAGIAAQYFALLPLIRGVHP